MQDGLEITNINQAVEVGVTLPLSWFRGHSRCIGELTPKVFRQHFKELSRYREAFEMSLVHQFTRSAPIFTSRLPSWSDRLSWLFIAQHYGLPTRLLDWSENVLTALYFAVSDPREHNLDGELWAMYPQKLNLASTDVFGIPLPNNKIVRFLALEAWHNNPKELAEQMQLASRPQSPVAISPPLHFDRIAAQMGTFTIHPEPIAGRTIPELLTNLKSLVRYIIPSSAKAKLASDLRSMNVSKQSLFPGLEALASDITSDHHMIGYGPPEPPRFFKPQSSILKRTPVGEPRLRPSMQIPTMRWKRRDVLV